ncbi:MAG: FoF1 ATP synthase subunit delta, partial [Algoriphagus sp.]|uniref:F0F1 ATP synthase subunit delta n=1 Tax=Algoriphagus sp. TaxID=1872435 RepID=UPI0032976C11
MSNQRVASRYAKSIMELSLEKGRLEEVHTDFLRLTALAESNHELKLVLRNPIVNSDKKLNVLKALFAKGSDPLTMTFFEIISQKNREEILLDVAKEFENQYNLHMSIQVAEVTTTFA